MNSVSTTTTATSLTAGSAALPLFVDGVSPYTGAFAGTGPEITGYAGRIAVNPALVDDPSKLVTYQTSPPTAVGDATRPNFIYNQLVNATGVYSPDTGVGGTTAPFQGTLSGYISQIVSMQSLATNTATNLQTGQDTVVNSLQSRFNSNVGGEYRYRNGEPAHAAELLWSECARDVDDQGDDGLFVGSLT